MSTERVQVDTITSTGGGNIKGSGMVAQRLLANNFNVNALRTNDVLRQREWVDYDTALLTVARQRLTLTSDLLSAGLRYPLANALGITRVEWESASEMTPASISMSGLSQSDNDRVEFSLTGLPVPIIHKDFNINIRALEASRRTGQALDTMQLERSTRMVAETIESMIVSGYTGLGSNNTIYGYTTAPQRNTYTSSNAHDWDTDSTGEEMLADLLAMIDLLVADNMYGPYVLYVTNKAYTRMGGDFKSNSDKSILQRLLEVPGISAIRPAAFLGAKQQVLVQMTKDVVDMIDGIQPTLVQWSDGSGFITNFKVMAIMLPRIRNDYENQSGIVHATGT